MRQPQGCRGVMPWGDGGGAGTEGPQPWMTAVVPGTRCDGHRAGTCCAW